MPKLSANLTLLFTEVPFMQRFAAAASAGFSAVEFQFPYEFNARDIRSQLEEHDLDLVLFNIPAGDWHAGDRGLAADWERRTEFREGLNRAMDYAEVLRPNALNLLAGVSAETAENDLALLQNIRIAGETLAEEGFTLLIEPLNTIDHPGFALPTAYAALDVISEVDAHNVQLQLDVYHAITMGEDPLMLLQEHVEMVGHIQIADVPGRHEPGSGEVDWNLFFRALDAVGYDRAVGLEYVPSGDTVSSFSLLNEMGLLH